MSTIGGKNYKKFKKESKIADEKRYLISKSDFQDSIYAKVVRMLGGGRLIATGEDKIEYNCVIRGRLYKKEWIKSGDTIIILPRAYMKQHTADVLHKMNEDEINEHDVSSYFAYADSSENQDIKFDTTDAQDQFSFDDL
jgi:translation initiation factor 1A